MADTAECRTCHEVKAVAEFRPAPRMVAGHRSDCRACDRQKAKDWYRNNEAYRERTKSQRRVRQARDPMRYRRHGWRRQGVVDLDTAERLYLAQGPCELGCGRPGVLVDHNHETGLVRGWLCRTCNRAIARLGDTAERLAIVAEYAKRGATS